MKICVKCNVEKILLEYYPRSRKCKACCIEQSRQTRLNNPETTKQYMTEWRQKNPAYRSPSNLDPVRQEKYKQAAIARRPADYHRWKHILEHYGLTQEQWTGMFAAQENKCACCKGTEPKARTWHTDHNHTTNKVRGIVCQPCNEMIKGARDSKENLVCGIGYLERTDG